jgi:sulfatase maturation enzyme AslB (radical SAM superfamily)
MSQLNSTYSWLENKILLEARRRLSKVSADDKILSELRGMEDCNLLCPFCLYESKKNKNSGRIREGVFKCFACGKFGVVEK